MLLVMLLVEGVVENVVVLVVVGVGGLVVTEVSVVDAPPEVAALSGYTQRTTSSGYTQRTTPSGYTQHTTPSWYTQGVPVSTCVTKSGSRICKTSAIDLGSCWVDLEHDDVISMPNVSSVQQALMLYL